MVSEPKRPPLGDVDDQGNCKRCGGVHFGTGRICVYSPDYNPRPIEPSAPAAPCTGCDQDYPLIWNKGVLVHYRIGTSTYHRCTRREPPPAAIEEAERIVDRMTCRQCAAGNDWIPLGTTQHMISKENGGKFEPCTAQGRAIVDAILPILRSGK